MSGKAIDEIGNKYGRLTVIKRMLNRGVNVMWLCQCTCGKEKTIPGKTLRGGDSNSCGCLFEEFHETRKKELNPTQRFGKLVVIKRAPDRGSAPMYLCKCDCGREKVIASSSLRNGDTRSCGCLQKDQRRESMLGKSFGKLTVIKLSEKNDGVKDRALRWLCQCDCGNEKVVLGSSLRSGHTKSCGCFMGLRKKFPKGFSAMRSSMRQYKQSAKVKGHIWEIDEFQFIHLTQERCFYCGAEPSNFKAIESKDVYIYNGLDRVDNNKGYTIDNVVPCCADCNYAKQGMSQEDFIYHANQIVEHRELCDGSRRR